MQMRNVLLIDWHPKKEWEFLRGLEEATEEEWELYACDSSRHHGGLFQTVLHYVQLLYVPFHVILHPKRYKRVVAFHKIHGLVLAFYYRLFHVSEAPELTIMTFIYKPKSGVMGKLLDKFIRYCFKYEHLNKVVVYSNSEVDYYARLFDMPADKFFATNYCIEDSTKRIPIGEKGDYFLSVGSSNRDYAFLLSSWSKNRRLLILNDSIKEKTDNPNIEILTNCHGDDYLRLLANCRAVIIPLADPHISSGQLVIMQAMMYGKPIIVTKNSTLDYYVINGYDGIIIDKTNAALENAIEQLENEEYYDRMSRTEIESFKEKFSLYRFGTQIGNIV